MKKLLLTIALTAFATSTAAQVESPQASLALAAPTPADRDADSLPDAERPGDVELYAQIGAGVLMRLRDVQIDYTFSQRATFGLYLYRSLRVGAVLLAPMFIEASPSQYVQALSYLGGVEVAYRGQARWFTYHFGGNATSGAGPTLEGSWSAAFIAGAFCALGIAATSNTDFLIRFDAGIRVREIGESSMLLQGSIAIDWH